MQTSKLPPLLPFLWLAPVYLGGKALFWGTPALQFYPWWHWAAQTLLAGHLPLWNPLLGMGAPLFANYQSALLYPPVWALLALDVIGGLPLLAWGGTLIAAAHLAWAAWGMVRLTRSLGLGDLAQTVAGMAFGMSGYLTARLGLFPGMIFAAAWLPWVLLGVERLARRPQKGWFTPEVRFLALAAGMQLLSGHAQTTWYTFLLAGLWYVVRSTGYRVQGTGYRVQGTGYVRLGLAFLTGALLAAPQLLATAEYLLASQRASAYAYEQAMVYSFWPWRILGLIAPGMFGSPVNGDYWGYAAFWEDALYLGILPLGLAVGWWVGGLGSRDWGTGNRDWGLGIRRLGHRFSGRRAAAEPLTSQPLTPNSLTPNPATPNLATPNPLTPAFLLLLSLASLLLALGDNTPLFPWLYRHAPTFDMFQAPTRWNIWLEFALALGAAYGAERWRRPSGRALYWARLGPAGAFAVTLGAGAGWLLLQGNADLERLLTMVRAFALMGLWGVGAGLLTIFHPRPRREGVKHLPPRLFPWLATGWLALDLLTAAWGLAPSVPLSFYSRGAVSAPQVRAALETSGGRLFLPAEDERELKFERFFRFPDFHAVADWDTLRDTMLPDLFLAEGIASANNFDPLLPAEYVRWTETLAEAPPSLREWMLNRMAVSVVERANPPVSGAEASFQTRESLPRWRWEPCGRVLEEEAAWEAVRAAPQGTVILSGAQAPPEGACFPPGEARILKIAESPQSLRFQVQTESPGWFILADVWYPQWQARLDGERVPLWKADTLFRGVYLPAGEHEVAFVYRPWWRWSILLSLAALALLARADGVGQLRAVVPQRSIPAREPVAGIEHPQKPRKNHEPCAKFRREIDG